MWYMVPTGKHRGVHHATSREDLRLLFDLTEDEGVSLIRYGPDPDGHKSALSALAPAESA